MAVRLAEVPPIRTLHVGLGGLAKRLDLGGGRLAVGVEAVAGAALQIAGGQGLQHLGVGAEGVVVAEQIHHISLISKRGRHHIGYRPQA